MTLFSKSTVSRQLAFLKNAVANHSRMPSNKSEAKLAFTTAILASFRQAA
jgi:hypothetical protein